MSEQVMYLDRYQLVRQLGRGGMGEVWLAQDHELNAEVALKFVTNLLGETDTNILRRETKQARLLSHRHILPVYDFHFQRDSPPAISMEYAPGGSLQDLLTREKPFLEVSEIFDWVIQACEGLAYAHEESGIVHRDVKPGNIMLDATNAVKVADFGLSARLSMQLDEESERVIGRRMTLHYASPQLIWSPSESHYLNDIYALGVTIFTLVTATYPFQDPKNNRWNWDPDNLLSMSARRKKKGYGLEPIPENWDYAVARCLAENPADRPSSVRELAEMLGSEEYYRRKAEITGNHRAEISGRTTSIPLPSVYPGDRRLPVRRSPLPAILIFVFLVLGVVAGILWSIYGERLMEGLRPPRGVPAETIYENNSEE